MTTTTQHLDRCHECDKLSNTYNFVYHKYFGDVRYCLCAECMADNMQVDIENAIANNQPCDMYTIIAPYATFVIHQYDLEDRYDIAIWHYRNKQSALLAPRITPEQALNTFRNLLNA